MLGTVGFTFAAADAIGGGRGIPPHSRSHNIFFESRKFPLGIIAVIGGKGTRYIHVFRTWHTIAAAGTAYLHLCINGGYHLLQHSFIRLCHFSCFNGGRLPPAGSKATAMPTVPGSALPDTAQKCGALFRKAVGEPASPQGLHDDYRKSFFAGIMQTLSSRLGIFIHIIVLNLTKIPVISI